MKLYAATLDGFKNQAKFNYELAFNARLEVEKIKAGLISPQTLQVVNQAVKENEVEGQNYGIATFSISGALVKDTDCIEDWYECVFCGGTSLKELYEELKEVQSDVRYKAVLLEIDSCGGDVANTQLVANLVRNFGKPVYAYVNNMAASAAYWIAAQCTKVYTSTDTTQLGSIGVFTVHYDRSGFYEMIGQKPTYIAAAQSTDKLVGADNKELGDIDFAKIQSRITKLAEIFISDVRLGRGSALVSDEFTNAEVFMNADAERIGLSDGKRTPEEVVTELINL